MGEIASRWNELFVIALMMIGLYTVISSDNLVKKIIGLNLFQVSVIMFYVSMGKVAGGTAPILPADGHGEGAHTDAAAHGADAAHAAAEIVYSNPLPHVLMLTAIVVGVATTALGLSLIIRIKEAYGTVEEDEILAMDNALAREPLREGFRL